VHPARTSLSSSRNRIFSWSDYGPYTDEIHHDSPEASRVIFTVRLYCLRIGLETDQILHCQANRIPPRVFIAGRDKKSKPTPQISLKTFSEQQSSLVSCNDNNDIFSCATSSRTTLRRALEFSPLTFHTIQFSDNIGSTKGDQKDRPNTAQDTRSGVAISVANLPIPVGNRASSASQCEAERKEVKVSLNCWKAEASGGWMSDVMPSFPIITFCACVAGFVAR